MKSLRIIFILLIPFIGQLVVSCCNCDSPQSSTYAHCDFSANHLENSSGTLSVSTSTSISKDNYGIQLLVNRKEFMCSAPSQPFSFFSSTYAYTCKCVPKYSFSPTNTIEEITIYTVNDFDASHPAGSDISAYFSVSNNSDITSLSEYLSTLDPTLYSDNSFSDSQLNQDEIDLVLQTAPAQGTQHQFDIHISLSDGQFKEALTTVIDLI